LYESAVHVRFIMKLNVAVLLTRSDLSHSSSSSVARSFLFVEVEYKCKQPGGEYTVRSTLSRL